MTRDEAEHDADDAGRFPVSATTWADNDSPVGGRTLVGGAWTTAAQIAPYVFTTAVSIVAGRILGPSGLGRQSFIAFVVLVVMTACSGGFAIAMLRSTAEALGRGSPETVRDLARWGWKVAGVAAVVGSSKIGRAHV